MIPKILYKEYYQWQKRVTEGKSDKELSPLPKSHHKRHRHRRDKSYKSAGSGCGCVDFSQRHKNVERRIRAGDFKGDLINGLAGTENFVTPVERTTHCSLFGRVESKETEAVARGVKRLWRIFRRTCSKH